MNYQTILKYFLSITIIFEPWLSAKGQQLNVEETISYIQTSFKKYRIKGDDSISIRVAENGYVIIKGYTQCIDTKSENGLKLCSSEDKFHYKSVYFKVSNQGVLIMCSSPSYVNTPGCIQNWLGLNHFVDVGASFEIEGVQKICNAFQYLIDILSYDDRFNRKDDDPFSKDNYKKKVLVGNQDSSRQSILLKYNGNLSEIALSVCGLPQNMIFDSGASDVTISSDTEKELLDKRLISDSNYLTSSLYKLADGSIVKAKRLTLPYIKVGSFTVKDVICCVNPTSDVQLLGKSFLNRFSKWTINNDNHTLILEK